MIIYEISMSILAVAEKPSVAKELAAIISSNSAQSVRFLYDSLYFVLCFYSLQIFYRGMDILFTTKFSKFQIANFKGGL